MNPFQVMNINQSSGFVPTVASSQPVYRPKGSKAVSQAQSPVPKNSAGTFVTQSPSTDSGNKSFAAPQSSTDSTQKSFVERSMYKRELCKNWTETGVCRYGSKCQFAHGVEELSENHPLYVCEAQKQSANDKYKS